LSAAGIAQLNVLLGLRTKQGLHIEAVSAGPPAKQDYSAPRLIALRSPRFVQARSAMRLTLIRPLQGVFTPAHGARNDPNLEPTPSSARTIVFLTSTFHDSL
jgi:hypothetical protein